MTITAAQVKEARELLGWTQDKLAARAFVSPSSVNRLERDTRRPAAWVEASIVAALETAGIEFDDSGQGVRLRKGK